MNNQQNPFNAFAAALSALETTWKQIIEAVTTIKTLEDLLQALPEHRRPLEIVDVTLGETREVTIDGKTITIGRRQELALLIWKNGDERVGILVHKRLTREPGATGLAPWGNRLGEIRSYGGLYNQKSLDLPAMVQFPVARFFNAAECELCKAGVPHVEIPEGLEPDIDHAGACRLKMAVQIRKLLHEHQVHACVLDETGFHKSGIYRPICTLPQMGRQEWFLSVKDHSLTCFHGIFLSREVLKPEWWVKEEHRASIHNLRGSLQSIHHHTAH